MIKVINVAEQKKTFKKVFNNDCMSRFFVCINFVESKIIVSTLDNYNNVRRLEMPFENTWNTQHLKKLNLSSIGRNHVLWDFIFNKEGFLVETYKNTYRDLITTSKDHGTVYTMAEIVFRTKRKEFEYFSYETDTITVIDKI